MEAKTLSDILARTKTAISQTTPTRRFRWGISQEEAFALLMEAYRAEVVLRGRDFRADDNAMATINKIAKWLTDPSTKPSMLLYGNCGTGKTTILRAVYRAIGSLKAQIKATFSFADEMEKEPFRTIMATPLPNIISAQQIADMAAEQKASRGESQGLSACKTVKFLAIDDLGCEPLAVKNYGTEVTPITDILYARYDHMLPTMISTNLDRKIIRSQYGDRIADRFIETFEFIAFDNNSYRTNGK